MSLITIVNSANKFLLESGEWTSKSDHKQLLTFKDSTSAAKFLVKFFELFPQTNGSISIKALQLSKPKLKLNQKEKWIMEWIVEGVDLEVSSSDLSQSSLSLDGEVYFTVSDALLSGLVDKGLIIDYKFARVDNELYEIYIEVCPQTIADFTK